MKLIFACLSAIAALTAVVTLPTSQPSVCTCERFFNIPQWSPIGYSSWFPFQRNALEACGILCKIINDPDCDPDVEQSANSILDNIGDLSEAAAIVAKLIYKKCKPTSQGARVANFVVTDLATRIACFSNTLKSGNATSSLNTLGACVQASTEKDNANVQAYAPACVNITQDSLASVLDPIQAYYVSPTGFGVDLPRCVAACKSN